MEHISVNMAGKESYRELLPLVAPEARGMLMSDEAGLLLAVKDAGEDREEVCGAVLFCNDPKEGFLIPSIYVKKEYRRQGIGALLLTAAQQQAQACWATNTGCPRIGVCLPSFLGNAGASRLATKSSAWCRITCSPFCSIYALSSWDR